MTIRVKNAAEAIAKLKSLSPKSGDVDIQYAGNGSFSWVNISIDEGTKPYVEDRGNGTYRVSRTLPYYYSNIEWTRKRHEEEIISFGSEIGVTQDAAFRKLINNLVSKIGREK